MDKNTIEDELKRLPDLYELTGRDWIIEMHNVLTEPVCPTVIIYEEHAPHASRSRYKRRFDHDTFLEAARAAVDSVLRSLDEIKAQCPKEAA